MRKRILVALALLLPVTLLAQSIKDTTLQMHMFSFHVTGYMPAADLAQRYGAGFGTGASYWYKTSSNWLLSPDFTFFNSNTFKEDSIFDMIRDEYGNFISNWGEYGDASFYMRGYYLGLRVGKVLPIFGPNPNSGLMLTASAGFYQYKTYIYQETKDVPLLNGEYLKGWDHLSNGFMLNQFIGYLHLASNEPVNFYVGIDLYEGWARGRRDWIHYLQGPDHSRRFDLMIGLRFGWIFPINKRSSDTYYFF